MSHFAFTDEQQVTVSGNSTQRSPRRVWSQGDLQALGVRTDLETAASVLGIGRTKAYELARQNAFPVPVLRLGKRYVVPTAPLWAFLHVPEPRSA